MSDMKTVCIESPLAGDFLRNIAYARACLRFCLDRGVSPYASHLLLPQVYNDLSPEQREAGISAGLVMGDQCDMRWFFMDYGMSSGMERAWKRSIAKARKHIADHGMASVDGGILPAQYRLGDDWAERYSAAPTPGFGA
jgi:hypothetical protein